MSTEVPYAKEFDEGFSARRQGDGINTCPYSIGSEEYAAWTAGWRDLNRHFAERHSAFGA